MCTELSDGAAAVTQCRSHTVRPGITATDDNNVFTFSRYILPILKTGIKKALNRLIQERHSILNTF
ncbi:hypothetical protein D3C81_1847430 [compost metagenome]